ncbi:MAG TPA: hypothetical protein VFA18_00095 [Gemmataceae bacterium]|nr:hypothetical protein [Gemmataceae bacterium]
MAQVSTAPQRPRGFGTTERKDLWWLAPAAVFVGLMIFIVYSTWAGLQGNYFEVRVNKKDFTAVPNPVERPYLSPFYSPLIYDAQSPHAWIKHAWLPLSAAIPILWAPGLFRVTCYYYRKAYYRAFWADPPACVVGEPRKSYWGENRWPLILQNSHRYFMYLALFFLVILWIDAIKAFIWHTTRDGVYLGEHDFVAGMGLGSLVMLANVILLTGFTLGCNSVRHLFGGRVNCFNCTLNGKYTPNKRPLFYTWKLSTYFNINHMAWAWFSLFSVGFTDLYIRLVAMGIWHDPRIF